MRKNFFYFTAMSFVALFVTSCSQDEVLVENNSLATPAKAVFNVSLPTDGMTTRGADTQVKRYAIAIDGMDLGNSKGVGASKIQDNGTFEIEGLTTGQQYTVTFWADYDDASLSTEWVEEGEYATYDINWLTYVKQNKGTHATMCYCGSKTITVGEQTGDYEITLKRAVAQVNMKQTTAATKMSEAGSSDWIKVSYNKYAAYNAQTGTVTGETAATDYSYEQTADLAANADLGSFYVWANTSGNTDNLAISYYATEAEGTVNVATVNNVPLKANYKTNISGNFNPHTKASVSFNVTSDDTWGGNQDGPTW